MRKKKKGKMYKESREKSVDRTRPKNGSCNELDKGVQCSYFIFWEGKQYC